jgi:RHS repeat-associated protein
VVTDENDNVAQTLDYYPYGGTRVSTNSGTNEARKYINRFADQSGLDYLNARYYDSSRGQFTSQDPVFLGSPKDQDLTNPQSLNSYSYANDNPVTNKDPDGKLAALALAGGASYSNPITALAVTAALLVAVLALTIIANSHGITPTINVNVPTSPSSQIVQTVSFPIPTSQFVQTTPFTTFTSQIPIYNFASPTYGPGKDFSPTTKKDAIEKNAAANDGQTTCTNCGESTVPAQKGQKGVSPPGNETNVDHKIPKSRGGTNDPSNADVLCRDCNLLKGNNMPWEIDWTQTTP